MSSDCDSCGEHALECRWEKSTNKLPKENKRYLGYCSTEGALGCWTGIIEVWFCPETGWHRCEHRQEIPIRVIYWREMIDVPNE